MVWALLFTVLRPMMKRPSGVRSSLPRNVVVGRPMVTRFSGDGVGGGGGKATAETFEPCVSRGSNNRRELIWSVVLVPSVVIRTLPSTPTATPSGFVSSATVWVTPPARRSMTVSDELPLLLT